MFRRLSFVVMRGVTDLELVIFTCFWLFTCNIYKLLCNAFSSHTILFAKILRISNGMTHLNMLA